MVQICANINECGIVFAYLSGNESVTPVHPLVIQVFLLKNFKVFDYYYMKQDIKRFISKD